MMPQAERQRKRHEVDKFNAQYARLGTSPQEKEPFHTLIRKTDAAQKARYPRSCIIPKCLGRRKQIAICLRPAITSHTIQRAILEQLAGGSDQNVLNIRPINSSHITNVAKKNGANPYLDPLPGLEHIEPKPEPPSLATTMNIACADCDRRIFEMIENHPIQWPDTKDNPYINDPSLNSSIPTFPNQLFRLAYRVIVAKLARSQGHLKAYSLLKASSISLSTPTDASKANICSNIQYYAKIKHNYDLRLLNIKPMPMQHLVITVQLPIQIAALQVFADNKGDLAKHYTMTLLPHPPTIPLRNQNHLHWAILSAPAPITKEAQKAFSELLQRTKLTFNDAHGPNQFTLHLIYNAGLEGAFSNESQYNSYASQNPSFRETVESITYEDMLNFAHRRAFPQRNEKPIRQRFQN